MRTKEEIIEFTKSLRVLLVEDTSVDRRLLEEMLSESSGVTSFFKSADSLKQAMDFLAQHCFDVIVLDLNLPDSRGIETLHTLRKQCTDVAIVVNTGAYEDDLGIQTLSAGAQDFLVKGKYNAYILNKVLHYALERKRMEEVLKKAYLQVKDVQNQLVQSEKFKVVGTLATGVAHEVKNPLATILYGIEFLFEHFQNKDKTTTTVLSTIKDAVRRANTIVADLMELSDVTHLKKKHEDIHHIIEKAISLTRYQLDQKHIHIQKQYDRIDKKVNLDAVKIEQVIINLILNAGHAMSDGGTLKIRTWCETPSESLKKYPRLRKNAVLRKSQWVIFIEIQDNGCGIPEEKLNNIFDPFFTSRRAAGGVGLGLFVSKNIIDLHQGEIFIENMTPHGARAVIILPAE